MSGKPGQSDLDNAKAVIDKRGSDRFQGTLPVSPIEPEHGSRAATEDQENQARSLRAEQLGSTRGHGLREHLSIDTGGKERPSSIRGIIEEKALVAVRVWP